MKIHLYAALFCALLFGLTSIMVMKLVYNDVIIVDELVKDRLQYVQGEGSLAFFRFITELGSEEGIIPAVLLTVFFLWRRKRYVSIVIFPLTVIVTNLVNHTLKTMIGRERPSIDEAVDAVGFSFPSGHAMLGLITYACITFLIVNEGIGKYKRIAIISAAALLIILIGLSRIMLSVHYPSDVLGGYCISGLLFVLFLYIHDTAGRWMTRKL